MINYFKKINILNDINYKFLLLFSVCQFTIVFNNFEIISYIFYYIIPFCFIVYYYKDSILLMKKLFKNKIFIFFFMTLIIWYLFCLIFPTIHATFDFTAFFNEPVNFIKQMIMQYFLLLVYCKYVNQTPSLENYLKYYILSCVLYVLGTITMLLFPPIKEFFLTNIKESEHAKIVALQPDYITRYGWSGFSNFEHSIKCSLSVALCGWFIIKDNKNIDISFFLPLIICFIGNMFYARIGMIISILIIAIIIFKVYQVKRNIAKLLLIIIIWLILLLLLLGFLNPIIGNWVKWMFINIINMFNGTGLLSGSLGIIFNNMIFMPKIKTLLIGDGLYTSATGSYYMNTDVGFMRSTLFGGIPYTLIRYSTFFSLLYIIYKEKKDNSINLLIVFFIIIFIFGEIKGEIIVPLLVLLTSVYLIMILEKDNIFMKREK